MSRRIFLYEILMQRTIIFAEASRLRRFLFRRADLRAHADSRLRKLNAKSSPQELGARSAQRRGHTSAASRLYLSLISPWPFPSRIPMRRARYKTAPALFDSAWAT